MLFDIPVYRGQNFMLGKQTNGLYNANFPHLNVDLELFDSM